MKVLLFVSVLLLSQSALAQDWVGDYDEALEQAAQTSKPLLLVFAGSDWCAPCIKLDREIWASGEFKAYSKENYLLYRADFPRKKKNQLSEELSSVNSKLADRFNSKGYFPLVVLLDSNEQILGTTSYKKLTPKAYISHLNSFLE